MGGGGGGGVTNQCRVLYVPLYLPGYPIALTLYSNSRVNYQEKGAIASVVVCSRCASVTRSRKSVP